MRALGLFMYRTSLLSPAKIVEWGKLLTFPGSTAFLLEIFVNGNSRDTWAPYNRQDVDAMRAASGEFFLLVIIESTWLILTISQIPTWMAFHPESFYLVTHIHKATCWVSTPSFPTGSYYNDLFKCLSPITVSSLRASTMLILFTVESLALSKYLVYSRCLINICKWMD